MDRTIFEEEHNMFRDSFRNWFRNMSVAGQPQLPHHAESLGKDSPRHLRLTYPAIRKHDGQFCHLHPSPERPILHFDLKAVTVGTNAIEVDAFECVPAVTDEAAGEITNVHTENRPRV